MNFKKSMPYLLSGLLVLSIASCKKDNEVNVKPEIKEQVANSGKDTTTVGSTLLFHPKISNAATATYLWTVNGVTSGTDSVFNFKPTVKGDYKISFKATTRDGVASLDYQIHTWAKYENGFYIVNEGWYGHGTGTVSFYRYDTKQLEDSLFVKENPTKNLNPASSTLQSGVIYNGKFYLVSKVGGPMVVTDEYTLKEIARIPAVGGNDWRSIVGVDAGRGLLSSGKGLFPIDLNTLQLGTKVADVNGQVADLLKVGNYIFALSATDGLVVLNAADYSVVKKIPAVSVGFARTTDGNIWAIGGTKLYKITPNSTVDVEVITLPFSITSSWGAWHPGSITASTTENAIFFPKQSGFAGATTIYKYIPGNLASLNTPFITLPTKMETYGSAVSYNTKLNQLVVTTVQSGYGQNYSVNNLYFYNPLTGQSVSGVAYTGFYFPSVIVQHN